MDLQQFIADVLTSIMAGVKSAESAAVEHGAVINPHGSRKKALPMSAMAKGVQTETEIMYQAREVEFDVALTVEHTDNQDAGGRVAVLGVGVGGKLESTSRNSTVSRVKFSLPIILPSIGQTKG